MGALSWPRWALLLVGLVALPVAGQGVAPPPPAGKPATGAAPGITPGATAATGPDYTALEREVKVLEALSTLRLTRAQAQAMLPQMRVMSDLAAQREAARRTMLIACYPAATYLAAAVIAGSNRDPDQWDKVNAAIARFQQAEARIMGQMKSAYQSIDDILTPAQRALFEPDTVYFRRLATNAQQSAARAAGIRLATADITEWARTATDRIYQSEKPLRIRRVAQTTYPGVELKWLTAVMAELGKLYDRARSATTLAYGSVLAELPQTLQKVLPPPVPVPSRYLMTRIEWAQLLQDPLTAELLIKLVPSLPEG